MGFEPMTSCLLDRRSNHLSYGASLGDGETGVVEGLIFELEPAKQLRSFLCVWQKTEECEADIARQRYKNVLILLGHAC